MAIFDDLQYCKSSKRGVGGPKKRQKHDDIILEWSLSRVVNHYNLIHLIKIENSRHSLI